MTHSQNETQNMDWLDLLSSSTLFGCVCVCVCLWAIKSSIAKGTVVVMIFWAWSSLVAIQRTILSSRTSGTIERNTADTVRAIVRSIKASQPTSFYLWVLGILQV